MKYRNPLLIPLIALFILLAIADYAPSYASSTPQSDYKIAVAYAKKHYPKCKIHTFTQFNPKVMRTRKNKGVVYIEKFTSYSRGGKYGYSAKGEYVKYNKYVKKGQRVISYFIYNPYSNYDDDVVAVVDCKMIR